jgi:ABC-type transport system involved in cytochrome bd biosynthesis fused ATPase/permease subunit
MKDDQEDYCANHCDQKAIEIQARHASRTEDVEKPAPDDRTNNSKHEQFVEPPYIWRPTSEQLKRKIFCEELALRQKQNVVVIAQGGAGKSTLCNHIVGLAAQGGLRIAGQNQEPVLIEGFSYSGDLFDSIVNVLKRNKVC